MAGEEPRNLLPRGPTPNFLLPPTNFLRAAWHHDGDDDDQASGPVPGGLGKFAQHVTFYVDAPIERVSLHRRLAAVDRELRAGRPSVEWRQMST